VPRLDYDAPMEHHDCQPPRPEFKILGDQLPMRWTCPDCGDAWESRIVEGDPNADAFAFFVPIGGEPLGLLEWVRLGPEGSSPEPAG
jgi:hypothetical protein